MIHSTPRPTPTPPSKPTSRPAGTAGARVTGFAQAAALALSLLLPSLQPARAEIRPHTLKFSATSDKGHPTVQGMEKFAALVDTLSGGRIAVTLFTGGALGGDLQMISAMQGGTVEMSVMNVSLLAGLSKDFALVDLPFLFETPKQADAVMDGPFGAALARQLPDKGLVGLGYWEQGYRNLTNSRRPVASVDDIAGLKVRVVQTPVLVDLFTALGAKPVPMPFPEVYAALDTGTVDGQENPLSIILNSKFYEVQGYLTTTRHVYNPTVVLIGRKAWDALNGEERQVLEEAARQTRDFQRAVSRARNDDALAQLKAKGMQITEFPAAELAKLRDKVKPVIDKHAAAADPAMTALFRDALAKARETP